MTSIRTGIGRTATALLALALLCLGPTARPHAATHPLPGGADGSILFSADQVTYHHDMGVVVASGRVEVSHGSEVLLADSLTYSQREDKVTAQGNVSLLQGNGNVYFAEFIELSADLKEGTIQNLRVLLTDQSRAAAASGTRSGDGRYTTLYKAVYSPCRPCEEDPSAPLIWQLKAHEIRHDDEDMRIEYKDAFLEVMGVPVAYTPYFSHADPRRKRESGFLAPKFGGSSDLGPSVATPYYFNLAPSRDLTLTPQLYLSESQPLLIGNYREHTGKGRFEFDASGTYIGSGNDKGARAPGKTGLRGHVDTRGTFDIDDTWRWGFDVARTTDDTYLRRYGFEERDAVLESRGYVEGFRHNNYATAEAIGFQNLRDGRENADIPDMVVRGQFAHQGEPARHGGYWTANSSAMLVNRNHGLDTHRLTGSAGWNLPYVSPLGEVYELTTAVHAMGYAVHGLPNPNIPDDSHDGFSGRVVPEAILRWRLPLARTRGTATEVLEPIAAVRVAPNFNSTWKIPNEDSHSLEFNDATLFNPSRSHGLDRYEGGQRVDYGVRWGVYGSGGGSTELFVGQSFRPKEDDSFGPHSGLDRRFSDIVGHALVAPSQFLNLRYRFRADQSSMSILQSETSMSVGPRGLRLDLGYLFMDAKADSGNFGSREEITGSLNAQLTRYWSGRAYASRRLTNPAGMMDAGLGLVYEDECFEFETKIRREYFTDRDIRPNDSIVFSVNLKGIGGTSSR